MLIKSATAATGGGLGYPSKMPGTSYGIPAAACKIGSKLAGVPGSVCHGCYALKGNYLYDSVRLSQRNRLASISNPLWTAGMVALLERARGKRRVHWHRWHDSGDLQSVEHLTKICAVAALTPRVRHWLPTRELAMVKQYIAQGGTVPTNLVIRISATMVDGAATATWPTTSGVHHHAEAIGRACPAPRQGNKCGACRACWSPSVAHISYHKH